MCREIFKMTNIDRYNKFKAELVSNLPSELSTYQLRIADQQSHIDDSISTITRINESLNTDDLEYKEQVLTEACKTKPFYFYHLFPKNIKMESNGLKCILLLLQDLNLEELQIVEKATKEAKCKFNLD